MTYGRLSWIFAAISGSAFILAIAELPRNDGIDGTYLNMLLNFAQSRPTEPLELHAVSPFDITEARVISALLVGAVFSAIASMLAGIRAWWLREEPRIYAGSVALGTVLVVILSQYRWAFEW